MLISLILSEQWLKIDNIYLLLRKQGNLPIDFLIYLYFLS